MATEDGLDDDARLLIIDDDPTALGLLLDYLADCGLEIFVARSGAEGLVMAGAEGPGLILLDIRLPDLGGYEICRRLKASRDTAPIPVIFLTVLDDSESKLAGFGCGAVDYICKSALEPTEVQARVMTHLSQGRRLQRLSQRLAAYEGRFGPFTDPPAPACGGESPTVRVRRMEDARRILDAAVGEHIGIEALAERVHLHPSSLSRQFRAVYGQSLSDYRREGRLLAAAQLLRDTDIPIKVIVLQTGYRYGSDFATAFRRRFGVSPSAYRASTGNRD